MRDTPATLAFADALRARTRWTLATPVLVAANVVLFVWMAVAPGPIDSPETLVAWGGSIGPRTTNGEWWRLVTAPFVHTGFVALAANMIGLVQPARLLERLVGPLALVGVYLVAGMFATVVSLPQDLLRDRSRRLGCGLWRLTVFAHGHDSRHVPAVSFDDSDSAMFRFIALAAAAFVLVQLFLGGAPW